MAGDKYVIAAADNPTQIAIRNILNPCGYNFLGNCTDATSFLRLIRSCSPDFAVVDSSMPMRDLREILLTVDEEMLCSCILLGNERDGELGSFVEKARILTLCPKTQSRDLLPHTVELSLILYKRLTSVERKLREMTDNFETRKSVERAKWILMQRDGVSEQDAYDKIRKKSMDTRMSMKYIADAIIFTHEMNTKKD